MIDWIDKSWDIVWKCAMTSSRRWSLVGYSKHEAQRRQTLGHQVWYVALPAPAGQMKMCWWVCVERRFDMKAVLLTCFPYAVITIAIWLRCGYNMTTIGLLRIARVCFHLTWFDASKKWTCHFFCCSRMAVESNTYCNFDHFRRSRECVMVSSYHSLIIVVGLLPSDRLSAWTFWKKVLWRQAWLTTLSLLSKSAQGMLCICELEVITRLFSYRQALCHMSSPASITVWGVAEGSYWLKAW